MDFLLLTPARILCAMRALLLFVLVIVLVGGGLKMAGVRLPFIDYAVGPMGVDTPGPMMPNISPGATANDTSRSACTAA